MTRIMDQVRALVQRPSLLFLDRSYFWHLAAVLIAGEFVLNTLIINKVQYTEIDWVAYMQEVKGFLDGQRDYMELRGDTGPLVYPAGFVYIYAALYHITNKGENIRLAQYLFEGLYLATQCAVFAIYSRSKKVPPYVIIFLCLSKRLHSIYVLRCFNDPVAMFFMYSCILAMLHRRWMLSSVLYSLALSIKMNVLLFFPAFGVILWQAIGAFATLAQLGVMIVIQIVLAYPFLSAAPQSYFGRAFEFGRVFDHQWTVNWRMVDKETFVSGTFADGLMLAHGVTVLFLLTSVWCKRSGPFLAFTNGFTGYRRRFVADDIILALFTSNLAGIVFARSLHYQFYSWYYHTLPYLLWQSIVASKRDDEMRVLKRLVILAVIEMCWLTYPSTERSSWTLLACHILILLGILQYQSR